ncbi:MAG TPA: hypothetical protein DD444_08775 [Citreicella sp.]|jgi:hypothetical protein|uniref:Lipoprotein n=1 Tax=Salipiger marinus TaxID=555512 RepID=A0A1G8NVX1_9RHOB|nr:hypothetical protein [Salipiger marinus]SDI84379.1 hypothetical protein SAMN04487993_101125 [Salipiger marinus]HBM59272.1 hypothetical protein [Citreicella sp.]HBT01732.1 hypothetical protein [Citreicella sp.]|tara:strand:+ start:420 stop:812 length:393 start_codon:yes stop_codon:yes gene_type:complete
MWRSACPLIALIALTACEESSPQAEAPFAPQYQGVETRLLDGDLVSFLVSMRGARDTGDLENYAECAAAQYALIRGYGFARHLRTNVSEEGGLWRGDAVYTISAALPRGLKTIDAEVVAAACAENGIPMV